ncbi:hypothetical protein [Lysinibacillus sphaericus]|uniref:hypothetical protein n=1 Tax=Lysinibacillus sphaericus TaxID=1421 RepID=UPI00055B4FF0|nr:hypothetical protein [Lysinibacillus sphaericus]
MSRITSKNTVIYIALCLLGVIFPASGAGVQTSNVWDRFYIVFYGFTEQGFSIVSFIYYCIVFLGFVYLFQAHLSIVLTERIYYQLIRYPSLNRWFVQFFKPVMFKGILLLTTLFSVSIISGVMEGKSLRLSLTLEPGGSVPILVYHFFINGFLQLMNYVLIAFIVIWVWKKIEYSLITLGTLMVFSLPILNQKLILPTGLNSLGHVGGSENVIFQISIILLIYLLVEVFIIYYLFKKRGVSL